MNKKRISLNSPVFKGRVRGYTVRQRGDFKSTRDTVRPQSIRKIPTGNTSPRVSAVKTLSNTNGVVGKAVRPRPIISVPENNVPGTLELALQAVGSTQVFQGIISPGVISSSKINGKFIRSKFNSAFYIISAIVFIFASTVSVQTFLKNRQVDQVLGEETPLLVKDDQGVLEGTGFQPAESGISDQAIADYNVTKPEYPRYLRIPELGVSARIKGLGENAKGEVDAPWNINDVGWYTGSTRPGNPNGSSLLLGHVSGWSGPGVFKNIEGMDAGTRFEVEKGNGDIVTYEVVNSRTIPLDNVDMGKILAEEVPGEHDLKLMTCAGKYIRDTGTYTERTVVYAKVVS